MEIPQPAHPPRSRSAEYPLQGTYQDFVHLSHLSIVLRICQPRDSGRALASDFLLQSPPPATARSAVSQVGLQGAQDGRRPQGRCRWSTGCRSPYQVRAGSIGATKSRGRKRGKSRPGWHQNARIRDSAQSGSDGVPARYGHSSCIRGVASRTIAIRHTQFRIHQLFFPGSTFPQTIFHPQELNTGECTWYDS